MVPRRFGIRALRPGPATSEAHSSHVTLTMGEHDVSVGAQGGRRVHHDDGPFYPAPLMPTAITRRALMCVHELPAISQAAEMEV